MQTASQTGSLVLHSLYVDLTEIMASICKKKRSSLQIGRTIFVFMVAGQTFSACFLVGTENTGIADMDQVKPEIHPVQ